MIGDDDFGVFFNPQDFAVPAILHLQDGDITVNVIFDNPSSKSNVSGGGFVDDTKASFLIAASDLNGLERRNIVTLVNKSWLVIFIEPDGTGMAKVVLGASDGNQSPKPSIRY